MCNVSYVLHLTILIFQCFVYFSASIGSQRRVRLSIPQASREAAQGSRGHMRDARTLVIELRLIVSPIPKKPTNAGYARLLKRERETNGIFP